jgi:hypothetical protein
MGGLLTMAAPIGGHINLHRGLRDHPYWEDPERLRAWIDILFMAAWKKHRRLVGTAQIEVDRGQFIASERFLSARWGWSRGKVRRFLEAAQEANEIEPTGDTSDGTTYRVVKYDDYQTDRPSNGTRNSTSNGPATDQREEGKEGEGIKAPSKKRWRFVPEDWEPKQDHRDKAKKLGLDLGAEVEAYRDHEYKDPKTDPDRTFNQWLRNAEKFGGSKPKDAPRSGPFIPGLHD